MASEPRQLDPDPLTVPWDYDEVWRDGYERGFADSPRSGVVIIALLLVGITAAVLGGMVGWAVGMGLR